MPTVRAVGASSADDDIPLLNAEPGDAQQSDDDAATCSSSASFGRDDSDKEKERTRREPKDGKYYDDPLWYGKSLDQIRYATDLEKSNGNAASREGDWKKANRYWKNALRGAEKLQDADLELRLQLNLALGYTRRQKTDKALEHCDAFFKERLRCVASAELRVKAHYRRAEAHEVAGEMSKAMTSLRAALEIDPQNSDARRKLAELKHVEEKQRERERELFRGKLLGPETQEAEASGAAEEPDGAEGHTPQADMDIVKALTDRTRSARLASHIRPACEGGSTLNFEAGPRLEFYGPLRPPGKRSASSGSSSSDHDGEADPAALAGSSDDGDEGARTSGAAASDTRKDDGHVPR